MSRLLPPNRPLLPSAQIEKVILQHRAQLRPSDEVILVVWRGYYRDTMGEPGRNDVGIYDDAMFWIAPNSFSAWNGNADPTRLGWNAKAGKFMARLAVGVWRFEKWKHKGQYWAFGQAGNKVTVERVRADGTVARPESGQFGINLHKGSLNHTSSEGCLTVPPSQWEAFRSHGYGLLEAWGQQTFPVILVENDQ
jgi:lysozyme